MADNETPEEDKEVSWRSRVGSAGLLVTEVGGGALAISALIWWASDHWPPWSLAWLLGMQPEKQAEGAEKVVLWLLDLPISVTLIVVGFLIFFGASRFKQGSDKESADTGRNNTAGLAAPPIIERPKKAVTYSRREILGFVFVMALAVPVLLFAEYYPASAPDFKNGLAAAKRGDYATALKVWRPLAEQGEPNVQYNLGLMYAKGLGVPQDYAKSAKWVRKAAEQGFAAAQGILGTLYHKGQGMPQDYAQAVKWYRKAAEQGHAAAQSNLGLLYANGQGVPRDYGEAVKWFRKAAEQGRASGQNSLGQMYFQGQGMPQDYAEAMKWYRKAAEQGYATAQMNLGNMYFRGQGVRQDYAAAAKWYRKAAEQGHQEAQRKLDLLEKRQVGIPGETLGNRLLQHDTLQHISFKAGFQSKRAGRATKNFAIKVIDTKVLVPPIDPAEGWVEKWTVRINGEQADYRVEYKSDGRGGYFIKSSVLK